MTASNNSELDQHGPMVTVISPAFNEAESLPLLIDVLKSELGAATDYEIIIVNDGSSDNSKEVLSRLSEEHENVFFVNFSRNFGHQAALRAGLFRARGACVIAMDADLQHPASLISEMLEKWRAGYQIVRTKRLEDKKLGLFKRLTSNLFYKLINFLGDTKLENGAADFFLLDRKIVDALMQFPESRWFLRGMLPNLGFKHTMIEYTPAERRFGETRYQFHKMLQLAIDGILNTSIAPLRFSIFMAAVVAVFALFYGVYSLFIFFVLGIALPGWTSVVLTVTIIGAMQLLMLGIIGEYLGRALLEVRNRPDYLVESSNLPSMSGSQENIAESRSYMAGKGQ